MSRNLVRATLATISVVLLNVFGSASFAQEVKPDSLVGDDLHYLGYVMITGDTTAWVSMKSDDVYHLSKAMFFR
ncbi:MAG: hypothetical protein ACI85G_001672, partial [Psychroserpens sp.]